MTDTAPENASTTVVPPPVHADAKVVERKRQLHNGRLQEDTFLLEAALERAYEIIEFQAKRIAELEGASA